LPLIDLREPRPSWTRQTAWSSTPIQQGTHRPRRSWHSLARRPERTAHIVCSATGNHELKILQNITFSQRAWRDLAAMLWGLHPTAPADAFARLLIHANIAFSITELSTSLTSKNRAFYFFFFISESCATSWSGLATVC